MSFRQSSRHNLNANRRPAINRSTLRLELLESRVLPTLYIVNSLADGPPTADGQLTLREAVLAATSNAASGDAPAGSTGLDTINFAPNLAFGTIKLAQGELLLNGGGSLSIAGPIAGNRDSITISGQNSVRVIEVTNGASLVSLDSLTLTQGTAPSADNGGGFLNAGTNITLSHVGVTRCSTAGRGSGIANSGTLTLNSCTVSNNGQAFSGGGILNTTGGTLVVNYSRIDDNSANLGAGIDNIGATATIIGSTIASNSSGADGGGLESGGKTLIVASTISGNHSGFGGGGIFITSGSTVKILDSTIAQNTAQGGGGGGIDMAGGTVTVVNCTILGNADVTNSAGGAGGIAETGGTLTLANSIVAQNSAGPSSADNNVALAAITTNNDNFIGGDPKLGPLQDNGGRTFTMNPQPNSPVIEAGTNAFATDSGGVGLGDTLRFDQRSGNRFVDGDLNGPVVVDQGAVEFSRGPVFPIVVGADLGHAPEVKVFDVATSASGAALRLDFNAYESSFQGGVRVAVGDINGDGISDIVTAPGGVKVTLVNVNGALFPQFDVTAGRAPEIKVFSGATGAKIDDFLAYPSSFTAGVFVALGDVNHDGKLDIITGPEATGQSGHTDVRVFFNTHLVNTGGPLTPDRLFNAYDPGFGGGVRVAAADLNGDGFADIITGPGIWSGPDVRIFDGKTLANSSTAAMIGEFLAYDFRYFGGVFVSTGDVNGDGKPDVVTGTNGNGGPEVKAFSGANILNNPTPTIVDDFFAYDPAFNGGARVAVLDVNGDGHADIITGSGPGATALVRIFDGRTEMQLQDSTLDNFLPFDVLFSGGVFVGG